jgi:hypothetical protein
MNYLFHVHKRLPGWRLVIRADMGMPSATAASQWQLTRERTVGDTNPDVRREVDEKGWSLFRLGGSFADIEAELSRHSPRSN